MTLRNNAKLLDGCECLGIPPLHVEKLDIPKAVVSIDCVNCATPTPTAAATMMGPPLLCIGNKTFFSQIWRGEVRVEGWGVEALLN